MLELQQQAEAKLDKTRTPGVNTLLTQFETTFDTVKKTKAGPSVVRRLRSGRSFEVLRAEEESDGDADEAAGMMAGRRKKSAARVGMGLSVQDRDKVQ